MSADSAGGESGTRMSSAASSRSRSDTSTSARAPRWCAHGGGPPEVIRTDFGMDTSVLSGTGRVSRRRRAGTAAAAAGRANDHRRSSKVLAGHLTVKRPSGLIVKDVVRERGYRGDRSAAHIPVSEMSDTDPMTCTSARAPSLGSAHVAPADDGECGVGGGRWLPRRARAA